MRIARLLSATSVTLGLFGAVPAYAHISLEQGGTHESRYGDTEIKQGPCGREGGERGDNVYTYRPGETITVTLQEYIPHPGYFRIAFDDDGDDDFVDPQTVDPINRECMDDPADKCGESDFNNNHTVLMDNLDPHDYQDSEGTYTYDVTLPNVTCDNCTLQVIQVMTDPPGIHAPYNPNEPGADDIYFQCIDLVLEGEPAEGAPPPPGTADAGADSGTIAPAGDGGSMAEGMTISDDGCSVTSSPSSRTKGTWGIVAALGLMAAWGRRRRVAR